MTRIMQLKHQTLSFGLKVKDILIILLKKWMMYGLLHEFNELLPLASTPWPRIKVIVKVLHVFNSTQTYW